MSLFHSSIWMLFLLMRCSASWCPHEFIQHSTRQFEQKTDRFWEFKEETNSWVEVRLPYDLLSCVNDNNCTKVGSLIDHKATITRESLQDVHSDHDQSSTNSNKESLKNSEMILPLRRRISLTRMSESSVWVTGQSGSIYERFWNGVQWVIAPHDLHVTFGPAISVFIVNQTILALSETGVLYQMRLDENFHPIWVEFTPTTINQSTNKDVEQKTHIKSGVLSHDGLKVYFCTKSGLLMELSEIDPARWINHGQPPGANVAAIADAATIRVDVVYAISSIGDLYEFDKGSKPSWKKHIWKGGTNNNASLLPAMGCAVHDWAGDHSMSLFLLAKGGSLVERRLQRRKWKWIVHGHPKDYHLTSITPVIQDDFSKKCRSLFTTASAGSVFEYQMPMHSGIAQAAQTSEAWRNHGHPPHAKVARGIPGTQLQVGRTIFALDDGRLAELHLSGMGGENSGPTPPVNFQRKASSKYIWTILDAPESEGWNTQYCTEARGPMSCISGIKDEPYDIGSGRSMTRRRKGDQAQQDYLSPATSSGESLKTLEEYDFPNNWVNTNFRLRVMHGGRSLFLITDGGLTFEYLNAENVWIWLKHEHLTPVKGALGNYNGSLFLVDIHGSLLIRERNNNDLVWINCTAMRKGGQVISGPPWDDLPGKSVKVTVEDALFFVSKTGRLLQFTVALRKFQWKDCRHPVHTRVASIIDQEIFRENLVFVIGTNGKLYQYNKITELWHEHPQSQHLVLSRMPGTAMRSSPLSLAGSLFMLSEDGGLVEYEWNSWDGWNWVEHGTPYKDVTFISSPGPSFEGRQLFFVGSDGRVYLRHMEQMTWKWKNCGYPYVGRSDRDRRDEEDRDKKQDFCMDKDFAASLEKHEAKLNELNRNCDAKVAFTRPIPFSDDSVIFELRDGRLGEMKRVADTNWVWSRIIGTPTSLCISNFWTAVAA